MSLPRRIRDDPCIESAFWKISPELAAMLVELNNWAAIHFSNIGLTWPGLWIISGQRSRAQQRVVNPDAPDSLHTACPGEAVDLRLGNLPASMTTAEIWRWLGARWMIMGGRWGGRFQPPDNNHFDRGLEVPALTVR